MEQRFLELAFTREGNTLTVRAPANANLATPGRYMLFVIDAQGVPSVARLVSIFPPG
jgi:NADPH-dependent ferric siderophore reductase